MTAATDLRELRTLAAGLTEAHQTDILLYSGELTRPGDGSMALARSSHPRRPNCLLVLRTPGGAADAAYRLARTLRRRYARILVSVDDYCKGAGMLLALAADELVISDFGELGPLDLAAPQPVTPGHSESGRTQRLQALRAEAESFCEQHDARLRSRQGRAMSAGSAVEQAAALSAGPMGSVLSQIDRLHVADVERAMRTAALYVQRLGPQHLKDGGLERLLSGYPSHDFVIDREEASEMLRTVRAPSPEEDAFLVQLEPVLTTRRFQGRLLFLEEALTLMEATVRLRAEPQAAPVVNETDNE
jgi:hypothetical protein